MWSGLDFAALGIELTPMEYCCDTNEVVDIGEGTGKYISHHSMSHYDDDEHYNSIIAKKGLCVESKINKKMLLL